MPNPALLFKLLSAKKQLEQTHPKAAAFARSIQAQGIEAGSVIELTITRPDGTQTSTNLRVQPSDLEILQELQALRERQDP